MGVTRTAELGGPESQLARYQASVVATDRLPAGDMSTPVLGLFGEVGSLLAIVKKQRREAASYANYDAAILEELGDTLWYFTCIVSRAGLELTRVCEGALVVGHSRPSTALETWGELQGACTRESQPELWDCIVELATLAGGIVGELRSGSVVCAGSDAGVSTRLSEFLRALAATAVATGVELQTAATANIRKILSRWPVDTTYPPLADGDLHVNERLPRRLEIFVAEHTVAGKTYVLQKCNGIIIGDRLTDNKAEQDDYRFHDVFHLAYAVHLGWSPVMRALFRVKRKSDPRLDENEDGARAVLIEEGVATFIFGRALERGLFEGLTGLDFDLLKLVQGFVRGFEPQGAALWQWERAILDGFRVFRELKVHRRGYVVADLERHILEFRPGDET